MIVEDNRARERLVSREAVDWVLRGTGTRMQPLTLVVYQQCGYQTTRPLSFYSLGQVDCLVKGVATVLYPNFSEEQRLEQIGRLIFKGFVDTFEGHLWQSRIAQLSTSQVLRSMLAYFRAVPGTKYELTIIGPRQCQLLVTHWPASSEIISGMLTAMLEFIGGQDVQVTTLKLAKESFHFTLIWSSYFEKQR